MHLSSGASLARALRAMPVALLFPFAVLVPSPAHAGEAGIDVPMRRDAGGARPAPAAADPAGLPAAAALVRREIEILRRELGVGDFPARVEPHQDRRLVHVYMKALEAMSKVRALQRRLGAPESYLAELPVAEVSSDETLGAVQEILSGIQAIKTQMVIATEADAAPPASRLRGLSAAYHHLAEASVLLDGLVGGELTPRDVFHNVMAVVDDLNLIATNLRVSLDPQIPEVADTRGMVDVSQQAMRAAYKVIALQARLGMEASAVPTLTMVRVSPTEAHDLIRILRAELTRIKWHLGINVPPAEFRDPGMTADSTDVFAHMLLVVRGLDQLTSAQTAG